MFSSQFARSDFTRSYVVNHWVAELGVLDQIAPFEPNFRVSVDKEVDKAYPALTPPEVFDRFRPSVSPLPATRRSDDCAC